jgi:hypothetical protein
MFWRVALQLQFALSFQFSSIFSSVVGGAGLRKVNVTPAVREKHPSQWANATNFLIMFFHLAPHFRDSDHNPMKYASRFELFAKIVLLGYPSFFVPSHLQSTEPVGVRLRGPVWIVGIGRLCS